MGGYIKEQTKEEKEDFDAERWDMYSALLMRKASWVKLASGTSSCAYMPQVLPNRDRSPAFLL